MRFRDILRDVNSACGSVFYHTPSNEYILQAAAQIYIEERKLEEARKEENDVTADN